MVLDGQTGAALRAAVVLPWRANRGIFAGQLLITVTAGLAPVAAAWLLRSIMDSLTGSGHPADLPALAVALAAAGGVQGVLTALGQYLAAQSGRAVERHATAELFAAVGRLAGSAQARGSRLPGPARMAQRASTSGPGAGLRPAPSVSSQPALTVSGFLVSRWWCSAR